jgi:hypothetical protein
MLLAGQRNTTVLIATLSIASCMYPDRSSTHSAAKSWTEAKRAGTFRLILSVACQQRPKCIGATLCSMVAASLRSDGMSLLM